MGYSRILTGKWYTKESATLAATSFEMTYNKAYAGVTESVYSTKPYKFLGSSYVIGAVSQRVKQSWQRGTKVAICRQEDRVDATIICSKETLQVG